MSSVLPPVVAVGSWDVAENDVNAASLGITLETSIRMPEKEISFA